MTSETTPVPAPEKPKKGKARETLETLVVALVLAFVIRATIAQSFFIPSESMLPTLEINDRVLVEKLAYRFGAPHRGDIVVFKAPPRAVEASASLEGEAMIKRVIGLPGETIAISNGKVTVDGKQLAEPYVAEAPVYPEPDWEGLGMPGGKVPEGTYFMMGDNRNNSADSHIWGPLPASDIIGHAVFRFWPPQRIGLVR